MLRLSLLTITLIASLSASAANVPAPSTFDRRVRIAEYNPQDVYELTAHYGYEVHVWLAPGEVVQDIVLGDEPGWTIGPKVITNHFFIKPKQEKATTNLSIVTRTAAGAERVYDFHLQAEWPSDKPDKNSDMMYRVQFKYPDDEKVVRQAAGQTDEVKTKLANASAEKPRNYKYSFSGAPSFKPEELYDDGLYTYLRFPAKTPRPAIYYIDALGNEHIAETHTDEEWIVIHSVRQRLLFRKDDLVSGVFNDAFDATGSINRSGTISPDVRRVLKGGE